MKYFIELIESYLRLHEQGTTPEQEAQNLINNAKASVGVKIPVKEDQPNIFLRFSKKILNAAGDYKSGGKVTLNGIGTTSLTVIDQDNAQGDGYPKLIELLSGGQQKPSKGAAAGAAGGKEKPPTPGEIKDEQLEWKPAEIKQTLGVANLKTYIFDLASGKIPKLDLDKIPIFATLKQFFPDKSTEELIRMLSADMLQAKGKIKSPETKAIENIEWIFGTAGGNGSLAQSFSDHRLLVENIDGRLALVKRSNIANAKKQLKRIKTEIKKISYKVKNGEKVSNEECQKYQNMFVPLAVASKTKGRMFFPDPATGTGLVINDRDFKKKKAFDALLKSVGCSLGEDRVVGSLRGAAPDLRGKFMETLNVLVQKAMNCVNYKGPIGECADKLGDVFEDYTKKKLTLIEALRAYDEVDDAATPIGDEDQGSALALATLRDYFGDKVPEKILQSTLKLAISSFKIRRPSNTEPISKDTKYGKRGDTLESWETEEGFNSAMERQGVPQELYSKYKLDVAGLPGVDNSIKSYVTLKDDVGMGSLAKSTFKKLITNICDDCKDSEVEQIMEEVQKFRQGMANFFERDWVANVNDSRFEELQTFYNRTQQISDSVDNLSVKAITKNSNGKEILVTPLEDYIKTMREQLAREYSYSDYQQSELIQLLDSFDDNDDPRQIKGAIKSFVIGQEIKNSINSDATKMYLAMMAFGTGGSRNMITLLSANGVVDGESITCLQNSTLAPVKNFLDGVAGYTVQINGDGDRITFLGPKDVNNPEGESIPLYVVDSSISDTGNVTHAGVATYKNLKRSALTPKL